MLITPLSLSPTQEIALHRGLAFLRATSLRFAIELPDQSLLGTLPVPKEPPPEKVVMARRRDLEPKYGYYHKVDSLEVGQKAEIECESEDDAARLIKLLASRGCQKFGNGNCISAKRERHVELMRVV